MAHPRPHSVIDASAQLGLVGVSSTGFIVPVQIVHDGEIVHLGVGGMHGEGVRDVHGCIDTGQQVGSDHTAEEGGGEPRRGLAHGPEVVFFFFRFQTLGQGLGRVGLAARVLEHLREIVRLAQTEEHRLVEVAPFLDAAVDHRLGQRPNEGFREVLRHTCRHGPRQHCAGEKGARALAVGDFGQARAESFAPMALETLRRHTQPQRIAEGNALGKPGVVAVEKCCRVACQGMDLQEHGSLLRGGQAVSG